VDGKEASSRYQVVENFRSLRFTGHMTLLVTAPPSLYDTSMQQDERHLTPWFLFSQHLWPHTGRKHQLRKHLASIGHPIIGDG
jgi:hypothetical protein